MSSKRDATDAGAGVDRPASRCYRCSKPVRDGRMIRISSEPCPDLADRYGAVARTCCPDCAAGIGLLEFAAEGRAYSLTGSD